MNGVVAPNKTRARVIAGLKIVLVLAMLVGINKTLGAYLADLKYDLGPDGALAMQYGLLIACMIYALLLAVPFVPGVEIGVGLLTMFGAAVALHVYLATVVGLTLAFTIGNLVPLNILAACARRLRLSRLAKMLGDLAPLDNAQRMDLLIAMAPNRWAEFALRNRLLCLAILLNVPGNVLVGGGGGIALVAGMIGLTRPLIFVFVVALAVAPVPLLVVLLGSGAVFGN